MDESRDGLRGRLIARIIKESDAFEALYRRLQDAYTRAWNQGLEGAFQGALEELRARPRESVTASDARALLSRMEASLGSQAMRSALKGPVVELVPALYGAGGQEATSSAGVDFRFGQPDKNAAQVLAQGELHWVGNSWNTHTAKLLDKALMDYFERGMTREQLAERMREDFAGLHERGQHYWTLLADHAATKTREMGRVSGYEQAGIAQVQVRAHLDERTTAICRAMHGRIIPVSRLRGQVDDYVAAVQRRDMEAAKRSWAMHSNDAGLQGVATGDLPANTGSPPYHFRCRTITVAYQGGAPEGEVDRWRRAAQDRRQLTKEEVGQLIERAKGARWGSEEALKKHAAKHGQDMTRYNQQAVDRVRKGNRDVYLASKGEDPVAVFDEPYTNKRGEAKHKITVVSLSSQRIVTSHARGTLWNRGYDVQPLKQPGRGIQKWLIDFFTRTKKSSTG